MITARRFVTAAAAAAVAVALVALTPSAATSAADLGSGDYVTISNQGGVVHVGVGVPGQPLVGASANTNTGEVCVGFSYQVPLCTATGLTTTSTAIPSPVWVDADPSDGVVGAGVRIGTGSILAVWYDGNAGQACVSVGISRRCVQLT